MMGLLLVVSVLAGLVWWVRQMMASARSGDPVDPLPVEDAPPVLAPWWVSSRAWDAYVASGIVALTDHLHGRQQGA